VEYLKNNPEVMFEIENRLRTTNNLPLLERQKEEKEEE